MKGATLGLLTGIGLGAVLLIGMLVPAIPAMAQMFPLSETQLPPGTYVVTTQGYWEITAWIAAHPGKTIPSSIIVVPEYQYQEPQIIVKEKTKTKVVHEEHEHEHHKDGDHKDGKKWKEGKDEGPGGHKGGPPRIGPHPDYGKKYSTGHIEGTGPVHMDKGDHKSSGGGGSSDKVSATAGN